ncbi:hypothetical protein Dsin_032638, partial [Dipteronia sinensis]
TRDCGTSFVWEKKNGGSGFRDLMVFNNALLTKQCLRLIVKPDSLAAKVLKSCYYLNCSFLNANDGGSRSMIWKGLLWRRGIIEAGNRWRISSKWLQGGQKSCVQGKHLGFERFGVMVEVFVVRPNSLKKRGVQTEVYCLVCLRKPASSVHTLWGFSRLRDF